MSPDSFSALIVEATKLLYFLLMQKDHYNGGFRVTDSFCLHYKEQQL